MSESEIINKLSYLEEMIKLANETSMFNIEMLVSVLSLSAAILGGALYFLIKSIIISQTEKEFKNIENRLFKDLNKELKEKIIEEEGSNSNGYYVRWANGLQICWNSEILLKSTPNGKELVGDWIYPAEFLGPVTVEVSIIGNTVSDPHLRNVVQVPKNISVYIKLGKGSGTEFEYGESAKVSVFAIGRWK